MKCVDRPFVCESCEFRFEDLDSLRLHKRKMEGVCDSYCPFDHELYTRQIRFPANKSVKPEIKEEFKEENSEEHQRNEVKQEPDDEPCSNMPPLSEISPTPSFEGEPSDWQSNMSPRQPDRFDPLHDEENDDDLPVFDDSEFTKKIEKKTKNDKLKGVRVKVKTISPFVHCPYCNQEYNIDEDSDAAFRLVIHVANQHPRENISFRYFLRYFLSQVVSHFSSPKFSSFKPKIFRF